MDGGGWVATHEDVTQQQRAELMLARTERFLATVLENVTQSIIAKDSKDLRYVFVNKAAEKLYGLPRSEIIGKSARDLFSGKAADTDRTDGQGIAGGRRECRSSRANLGDAQQRAAQGFGAPVQDCRR